MTVIQQSESTINQYSNIVSNHIYNPNIPNSVSTRFPVSCYDALAPNKVGSAFAIQYFQKAKLNPKELSRFYSPESHVCRVHPTLSGVTTYHHASGLDQIYGLLSKEYENQPQINVILIRQLQCQDSINGSVLVSLHGTYNYVDGTSMNFHQCSVLFPKQENNITGYLIYNDILYYETCKPQKSQLQHTIQNVAHTTFTNDLDVSASSNNNSFVESRNSYSRNPNLTTATPKQIGPTGNLPSMYSSNEENKNLDHLTKAVVPDSIDNKKLGQMKQNTPMKSLQHEIPIKKELSLEKSAISKSLNPASPLFVPSEVSKIKPYIDSTMPSTNSGQATTASFEKNILSTTKELPSENFSKVVWDASTANVTNNKAAETYQPYMEERVEMQSEMTENPKMSFVEAISQPKVKKTLDESSVKTGHSKSKSNLSSKQSENYSVKKMDQLKFNNNCSNYNNPSNLQVNNTDRSALISDRSNITEPSNEFRHTNKFNSSNYKHFDQNAYPNNQLHKTNSKLSSDFSFKQHNSNSNVILKKRNNNSKPQYSFKVLYCQMPKELKLENIKEILLEHMKINKINGKIVDTFVNQSQTSIEFDCEESAKQFLEYKLHIQDKYINFSTNPNFNSGRHSPNHIRKKDVYNNNNNKQHKQYSSSNSTYQQRQHNNNINNLHSNHNNVNHNNNNYQKSSSSALNVSSCTTEEGWVQAPYRRKSKTNQTNRSNAGKKNVARTNKIFEASTAPLAQAV